MFRYLTSKAGLLVRMLPALGMLAAVACTAGEEATPTSDPGVVASPTAAATAPPIIGLQPRYGGTLTLAQRSDPPTFDPYATSFSLLTNHVHLTHNRLIRYKTLGYPENAEFGELTFVPDLAESWDVSGGGTVFTFNLRAGVPWHNVEPMYGRTVNSTDVKLAFQRMAGIGPWDGEGGRFAGFFEGLVSLETPDPLTLVMTIDRPLASWLFRIADGEAAWIVNPDLVELMGADFGVGQNSLYGTGPFIHKLEEPGSRYVYVRNDNYFVPDLPYLDEIQWLIIPDLATQEAAFIAGQVHRFAARKPGDVSRIRQAAPDIQIETNPGLLSTTSGLMFNMENPKWQILEVRQAINLGINRDRIINDLFQGEGVYNACIPTALSTFTLDQDELKDLYKYDPALARQLLDDAGFTNNFEFELMTFTGYQQDLIDIAEMIQFDLGQIGVTVTLKPVPVGQGRADVIEGNFDTVIHPHSTAGDPDARLGGFGAGCLDIERCRITPLMDGAEDVPHVAAALCFRQFRHEHNRPRRGEGAETVADGVLDLYPQMARRLAARRGDDESDRFLALDGVGDDERGDLSRHRGCAVSPDVPACAVVVCVAGVTCATRPPWLADRGSHDFDCLAGERFDGRSAELGVVRAVRADVRTRGPGTASRVP